MTEVPPLLGTSCLHLVSVIRLTCVATQTQQEDTNTDVQAALITHILVVRADGENIIILNTRSSTTNALCNENLMA